MVLLKIVLIMFIGAVFAANENELEEIVKKVAKRYCKDNLDAKDKLAYMKCDNIIQKSYRDHIYDCIKKYEDHSHETSMKPMICYYANNPKPKSEPCVEEYIKEHVKTKEEQKEFLGIVLSFEKCLLELPVD